MALLAACMPTRYQPPPPPAGPASHLPSPGLGLAQPPATSPRGRGNPAFYEVFGRRYQVLPSSRGYRDEGLASWYGEAFHGRPTSDGTTYNMHGLTAAHKTLPLPTRVLVTNLDNGRQVVVTVNDRGPFVEGRVIDLSYGAARELDMVHTGVAPVRIEALAENPAAGDTPPPASAMYLQVGAFGSRDNAMRFKRQLQDSGLGPVRIRFDAQPDTPLYRVRIGPVGSEDEYDMLSARLHALQVGDFHLVTEPLARGMP